MRWYMDHGVMITAVYQTIDYQADKVFPWFVEQVTEARRMGVVEKSKALFAEVFKLMGNSGYIISPKVEKVVYRALRRVYFSDLEEVGQAYELESRKPRITISLPFQVEIAV